MIVCFSIRGSLLCAGRNRDTLVTLLLWVGFSVSTGAAMDEGVSPDYTNNVLLRDVRASWWVVCCAFLPDRFGVCGHFPPHPRITGLAFPTATIKLSLCQQSNFPYRQAAQFAVDSCDVAADHVRRDLLPGGQR